MVNLRCSGIVCAEGALLKASYRNGYGRFRDIMQVLGTE